MPQAVTGRLFCNQNPISVRRRSHPRPILAIDTPRLVLRAQHGADPSKLRVTIGNLGTSVEMGWIEFSLRAGADREVEFAFFLDPRFRGQGLMREAALAVLPQALDTLGARLVSATIPVDAPAAARIVRSLGLVATSRRGTTRRFVKDLCALI